MDWSSLERRPKPSESETVSFQLQTKKVRVTKDDLITLPDGTVIVKDNIKKR